MRKRIKKPYIAATLIVFLLCFMVKNVHAASFGTASVDGKSFDVEKVIINSTLKSRTVSTAFYQIKTPELTVKTPVATTCYWNKADEDRRCIQKVEIDNAGADLALKEAFGSSTAFKNLVIKAPEVLKKGAYNITYEFDYPANKGEEWNLTFQTPTVTFLIDPTISVCSVLNTAGETYTLTVDIINNDSAVCMDIRGDNSTLDCQGHQIDGDGINAFSGIYLNSSSYGATSNITVKNCIIKDYNFGVNFGDVFDGNSIINSSIYGASTLGTGSGILILGANNSIINSSVNGTLSNDDGVLINDGSDKTYIISSNFTYSAIGIEFYGNIVINNSYFKGNDVDICQEDANMNAYNNYFEEGEAGCGGWVGTDYWNTTRKLGTRVYGNGTEIGGNYWTNSTANGYSDTCTDLLMDGFCDDPYDVETGAACAAVADGLPACGNNTDWLPLSAFYEEPCVPSWNCTAWGECVRGYQTRECTDDNSCQNETGKPAELQVCLSGLPNASFNVSTGGCCPISTIYCTNNETLLQVWNTSEGLSWASENCPYGCDNATSMCVPVPYQQNLWLLVIFAAIVVVGLAFIRWIR